MRVFWVLKPQSAAIYSMLTHITVHQVIPVCDLHTIRHNLPLTRHAATDVSMNAISWVMIANSSNCLISPGWLASFAEGDSIINATLLYLLLY